MLAAGSSAMTALKLYCASMGMFSHRLLRDVNSDLWDWRTVLHCRVLVRVIRLVSQRQSHPG